VTMSSIPSPGHLPRGAVRHLRAWGTTVTLAVDRREALAAAETILRRDLDAIDGACSRFRPDAEIWNLHRSDGRYVRVSSLLFEAITVACEVAEHTAGAVDPTVGDAVSALGYDRDFATVPALGPSLQHRPRPARGWWCVELDERTRSVCLPPGVILDLGASAKAWAADRIANRISSITDSGTLVSLGGDVSVAGPPPPGGWPIGIALDASRAFGPGPVVSVSEGGLASSSTAVRTWARGGRRLHHIVDPATGDCASRHWRLISVAAASCVDANASSTAGIVWGESAPERLEAMGVHARLVRHDGVIVVVGAWPPDNPGGRAPRPKPKPEPLAS